MLSRRGLYCKKQDASMNRTLTQGDASRSALELLENVLAGSRTVFRHRVYMHSIMIDFLVSCVSGHHKASLSPNSGGDLDEGGPLAPLLTLWASSCHLPFLETRMSLYLTRFLFGMQKEASEVFFSVTKLYQSKDANLRRMVYLVIKDVCPGADEVIIITSSLMKDMNSKTDLYRSNAIRVLCSITDSQLLGQIERYLKQVTAGSPGIFSYKSTTAFIQLLNLLDEAILGGACYRLLWTRLLSWPALC